MLVLSFQGARAARGYGLSCATVAELDAALSGVRLDMIRIRIDPAPMDRLNALMVAALVERRRLNPAQVDIDFGLDPLASLATLGHAPWDWASMGDWLAETVTALTARGFKGPFLTVDLRPFHDAGGGEAQELAAALALGVHYLRALEARGAALEDAFRAVSFIAPVDADQFMGIVKLRALRKLWERVALWSEASPQPAVIHAETSWRMLTRRDPHVNILRNTIAAFAAGVGGSDSVTVLPFTQALGLPEAQARRLARNTSIVLMEEASLWRVADPAAGSGGVEALTDALCAKAWELFQEIEGEGGILVSLVLGKLQARIAAVASARMAAVATRREPLTGVSEFADLGEVAPDVSPVKPRKSKPLKARAKATSGSDTPAVIAAFLAGASRTDAAPPVTGELKAAPLPGRRMAEPFEALRDRADAALKRKKRRPAVTLATLGELAGHGARLQFMRNLFAAGGIACATVACPVQDESGALVCLVGSDAAYAANGARFARALKAKGREIWLAGRPGELEPALRKAGVQRFVFSGCDVVECLERAHEVLA
jgi:methylmalonyl-CoA mutase